MLNQESVHQLLLLEIEPEQNPCALYREFVDIHSDRKSISANEDQFTKTGPHENSWRSSQTDEARHWQTITDRVVCRKRIKVICQWTSTIIKAESVSSQSGLRGLGHFHFSSRSPISFRILNMNVVLASEVNI